MINEKIGEGLIREYNKFLYAHPLYEKHLKAIENWDKLKRRKKGVCLKCDKNTKTHLHHKDVTLIPKNIRSIDMEIIYVPVKDILYLTPDKIIENYMEKFEVEKNIKYFSVKWNEVLELCPKRHKSAHKKNS